MQFVWTLELQFMLMEKKYNCLHAFAWAMHTFVITYLIELLHTALFVERYLNLVRILLDNFLNDLLKDICQLPHQDLKYGWYKSIRSCS